MKKSTWLPAVIAPVVVAGAIAAPSIANAAGSSAAGSSPSAASVLASVATAKDAQYSGKLSQTSDLGLPSLPASSGSSSDTLSMLTASHDARVYAGGTGKVRVQLLGSLSEQDVVVNGRSVWTWDSKKSRATHVTLPSGSGTASGYDGTTTPSELAATAIAAIRPTTDVSKPTSTTVAGRSAWQVVLTPKSSGTLVKDVTLAVDKQTGLPLRAAVDAKGQSGSAVSIAYSSISFGTQPSRLFSFTPPSDAKVTTKDLSKAPASAWKHTGAMQQGTIEGSTAAAEPTVTGTGWSSIVAFPAGTADLSGAGAQANQLLGELTKQVSGGRAIQTSLVSVYITTDGRVFAGAVPVSALVAAAQ